MKNFTQINDLDRKKIKELIKLALEIKKNHQNFTDKLKNKLVATLFFEPSTRTRLSFEAAISRLGGKYFGFADPTVSSYGGKGESLHDTIQVVSRYSDAVIMRHPENGAAEKAKKASICPIINAGDGSNEHPTQTMLDLMSIYETQGEIDNLKIAMVGDLKYGRTVRSLSKVLTNFKNIEIFYVSPNALKMEKDIIKEIKEKIKFQETENLEKIIPQVDIVYMTRVQKERFKDKEEAKKFEKKYILKAKMLKPGKKNLKILHPLPRIEEISTDVDSTPFAYYFQQAQNGMYMRMALLLTIFSKNDIKIS